MKEPADPDDPGGPAELDLAKKAAIKSLGELNATDEVGLRIFTTDLGPDGTTNYQDLLPIGPSTPTAKPWPRRSRNRSLQRHPLYDVTQSSYDDLVAQYEQ